MVVSLECYIPDPIKGKPEEEENRNQPLLHIPPLQSQVVTHRETPNRKKPFKVHHLVIITRKRKLNPNETDGSKDTRSPSIERFPAWKQENHEHASSRSWIL